MQPQKSHERYSFTFRTALHLSCCVLRCRSCILVAGSGCRDRGQASGAAAAATTNARARGQGGSAAGGQAQKVRSAGSKATQCSVSRFFFIKRQLHRQATLLNSRLALVAWESLPSRRFCVALPFSGRGTMLAYLRTSSRARRSSYHLLQSTENPLRRSCPRVTN